MPITRDVTNIVWGFADAWYAPAGTAEPGHTTTLAEPGAGWTPIGFTSEGFNTEFSKDVEDIRVEENLTSVAQVITSADFMLGFEVAEDSPEMRQLAYGLGAITTTAAGTGQIGMKTFTLTDDLATIAICVMARNSKGFRDRIYVPRMQSEGSVGQAYKRSDKRVLPVSMKSVATLSSITIRTQTAAAV